MSGGQSVEKGAVEVALAVFDAQAKYRDLSDPAEREQAVRAMLREVRALASTETQWAVRCDKTGRVDMYGTTATGRHLAEQEVARRKHNSKLGRRFPTASLVSRLVTRTYDATEWRTVEEDADA